MKLKTARRKYKTSDSTLVQITDSMIISGTRDLADIAQYGWTAARIGAIGTLRDDFADMPTDEELMGYMQIATSEKNEDAENLRVGIRTLRGQVENKYGEGHVETVPYGWEMLSKMSDNDLVRCGRRVVRVATGDLLNLGSEGVTVARINALKLLVDRLDQTIDQQFTRIKERDIAVTTRINKGNELYLELTKLAKTGKTHWETRDESKYNDYIINESSSSNETATGSIASLQVVSVSVSVDETAQVITITHNGDASLGVIHAYFATMPTDGPNGYQQNIAFGTPLSITAGTLGFDPVLRTRLNLYNPNAGAAIPYIVEVA